MEVQIASDNFKRKIQSLINEKLLRALFGNLNANHF